MELTDAHDKLYTVYDILYINRLRVTQNYVIYLSLWTTLISMWTASEHLIGYPRFKPIFAEYNGSVNGKCQTGVSHKIIQNIADVTRVKIEWFAIFQFGYNQLIDDSSTWPTSRWNSDFSRLWNSIRHIFIWDIWYVSYDMSHMEIWRANMTIWYRSYCELQMEQLYCQSDVMAIDDSST